MCRYLTFLLFLFLVFPGLSLATTFVMVPDQAMVDQSPLVVEGKVVSTGLANTSGGLATTYQVEILETLKGTAPGASVTVRVPGGVRPDGTGFLILGAPTFAVGEEALLFLQARSDGTYDLVQLMLGAFKVKKGPGGNKVFRRDFGNAREVTFGGQKVPPGREEDRSFQEFKTWIRERADGKRPGQDYFVEPQTSEISGEEDPLQNITEPYTFFTHNGLKIRWFVFDGGGNAPWRANFNGLPAVAGTSATDVQNAVNAWTNDAGSNINYNYAGTTSATNGFSGGFDGINAILFEDPNNFIGGSFDCINGGVIAQGGPWFGSTQVFNGESYYIIAGADVVVQNGASCYLTGHSGKDGEETYAHELGHTLGLGHTAVGDALMTAFAHADGRGAQLAADDQAGIAALYPLGGGGGNTPPTISDITNRTINEDQNTGVINFTVNDAETAAGSLNVSGSSSNPGLVPNGNIVFGGSGGNRTVTVTPVANQNGSATITVTVSDGQASANDTFLLTVNPVNDPPSISNIPNQSTDANTPKGPISFTVSDIDNTPGSLVLSGTSSNQALVPNGNIAFGGSGGNRTVTVTPAPGQSGTTIITVTVSDGTLNDSDNFTLTVAALPPPAEPPTVSSIPNQTINEDGSTGPIGFTVSDPDTPVGSLALSGSSSNQNLIPNGNIVFGGSGGSRTVTVTPLANQSGSATVTVIVSDGVGSDSTQFIVTVQSVPDPPSISNIPDQEISVDTSTGPIPFTISDPDTALGALQLSATSFNTTLVPTSNITFGGSGGSRTVTVTPAGGETGVAIIRVTVSDGDGSDIAQFDVTVTESGLVLSYPDGDTGILGVRRADGGNDANNLAPTNPMLGIEYVFQVKFTNPSGQPPAAMKLILDGLSCDMPLAFGTPATGATYNLSTQLGPKALHTFHFEARDGGDNLLARLPETGENNGPQVQLLHGANMVGIPKNLAPPNIDAFTAFGTSNAYRWISAGLSLNGVIDQGSFQLVDPSGPVLDGEAYFMLRSGSQTTLPNLASLPDNTGNTVTYPLEPGWNLISPPYEGRVRLGDVQLRRGAAAPVSWLQAAANGWVDNAVYYFNGDDWGGTYSFLTDQGFLVSWLGYWLYLNRDDADYDLIFTRPGS